MPLVFMNTEVKIQYLFSKGWEIQSNERTIIIASGRCCWEVEVMSGRKGWDRPVAVTHPSLLYNNRSSPNWLTKPVKKSHSSLEKHYQNVLHSCIFNMVSISRYLGQYETTQQPTYWLKTAQNNWILTLLSSVELLNSWNSTCFIFEELCNIDIVTELKSINIELNWAELQHNYLQSCFTDELNCKTELLRVPMFQITSDFLNQHFKIC